MKKIIASLFALLLTIPSAAAANEEDGQVNITCPRKPKVSRSVQLALKQEILSQIGNEYSNPVVAVNLRCNGGGSSVLPFADLLEELNIENSSHPDGLAFGLSGTVDASLPGEECVYSCNVTIRTRATNVASGDRLSTRTESQISIREPLQGRQTRS